MASQQEELVKGAQPLEEGQGEALRRELIWIPWWGALAMSCAGSSVSASMGAGSFFVGLPLKCGMFSTIPEPLSTGCQKHYPPPSVTDGNHPWFRATEGLMGTVIQCSWKSFRQRFGSKVPAWERGSTDIFIYPFTKCLLNASHLPGTMRRVLTVLLEREKQMRTVSWRWKAVALLARVW